MSTSTKKKAADIQYRVSDVLDDTLGILSPTVFGYCWVSITALQEIPESISQIITTVNSLPACYAKEKLEANGMKEEGDP
jgi:hypothetical protein